MAENNEPQSGGEQKEETLDFREADFAKVLGPSILEAFNKCPGQAGNIIITMNKRKDADSPSIPVMHVALAMSTQGYGIVIRANGTSREIGDAVVKAICGKPGEWKP